MVIVLSSSELFSMPCGVCLTSIFENNKEVDICVYIFTSDMKDATQMKFQKLAEDYGKTIHVIQVDEKELKDMPKTGRYSINTFFRFLIPNVLKSEDKVLYLDVDMINTKSMYELWNTNIDQVYCAVVEGQSNDDIRLRNRLDYQYDYFNAGVLLMNLKKWREDSISQKCISYLCNYPERCKYLDQDALNAILNNQVVWLNYRYNLQEGFLWNDDEKLIDKKKWGKINQEEEHKVLIHYCGFVKTWHKESNHPYTADFLYYKSISLWKDYPLTWYYNSWGSKIKRIFGKKYIENKFKLAD